LLAKFEDVVPHQGNLLFLRFCSEYDFQSFLCNQCTNGVPLVFAGLLPESIGVMWRVLRVLGNPLFQFSQAFELPRRLFERRDLGLQDFLQLDWFVHGEAPRPTPIPLREWGGTRFHWGRNSERSRSSLARTAGQ